jgi:hypothetical protein
MDVVDAVAAVQTGTRGMHRDVPIEPVVIKKALHATGGKKHKGEKPQS